MNDLCDTINELKLYKLDDFKKVLLISNIMIVGLPDSIIIISICSSIVCLIVLHPIIFFINGFLFQRVVLHPVEIVMEVFLCICVSPKGNNNNNNNNVLGFPIAYARLPFHAP